MTNPDAGGADLSNSERLFRELQATARKSKQVELERLWTVLQDMRRAGINDYTLAKVGARLERVGGLRTQSLRNSSGKDYRRLIAAFAVDVCGKSTDSKPRGAAQADWIDGIPDIQLRSWARQMVEENKLLQRQVNELKSAFKALRVYAPNTRVQAPPPVTVATQPWLSAFEIELLKKSFDASRFAENGWTANSDGSVTDDIGVTVLPPGFKDVMDKLAAL
ncbi:MULTISPECIES: gamma-mobile-trio protein GmtX [Paraburkholderia]|uniref:gamma-mobile-trio protein GmtX n=1 Tax=Paraburkholderia TaxID=1822464 RepID=UPI0038BD7B4C